MCCRSQTTQKKVEKTVYNPNNWNQVYGVEVKQTEWNNVIEAESSGTDSKQCYRNWRFKNSLCHSVKAKTLEKGETKNCLKAR